MLKQIIIGTKEEKIKYHGSVRFLLFECNMCHRQFTQLTSYFRKQVKKRPTACCFCSPACRTKYFFQNKHIPEGRQVPTEQKVKESISPFGWLSRLFKDE